MRRIEQVYEARIEELKAAHAAEVKQLMRTVDVLAEQVEYLRAQLHPAPRALPAARADIPDEDWGPLTPVEVQPWMSEEEEDLRSLHNEGLLDAQELALALRKLGIEPTINES